TREWILLARQSRAHTLECKRRVRDLEPFVACRGLHGPIERERQVELAVLQLQVRRVLDVWAIALELQAAGLDPSDCGLWIVNHSAGQRNRLARIAARLQRPVGALALREVDSLAFDQQLLQRRIECR